MPATDVQDLIGRYDRQRKYLTIAVGIILAQLFVRRSTDGFFLESQYVHQAASRAREPNGISVCGRTSSKASGGGL